MRQCLTWLNLQGPRSKSLLQKNSFVSEVCPQHVLETTKCFSTNLHKNVQQEEVQ